MKARFHVGLLVSTLWLLSACAGMPSPPVEEEAATVAAGYGRAFGRLEYLQKGQATVWKSSVLNYETLTLFVRSAQTGQMQYMDMDSDGSFSWPLQAGEHVIVGYQYRRSSGAVSTVTARLMGAFSVPLAGQAVYIGDLQIESETGRIRMLDRYDEALKRVEARLAAGKFEPVKGLMRFERQAGSYKRVVGVCSHGWGLTCDSKLQGVEPLQPAGTAEGFPLTQNLSPLLEWKSASRSDVTYDIAIYESLTFEYASGTRKVFGLRGARVVYAEGLREPRYIPQAPLQPGKRYEWTVRLRDGDTVSSWSATSYSWFAVVAWKRGSGQGFGFETPEK